MTAHGMTRAERMARKCLEKAGVHALPVQPLSILRRCAHTAVMSAEQAAEVIDLPVEALLHLCADADAWTYRMESVGGTCYLVVYRTDGHPARLRFSLAHELGHIVLGHRGDDAAEEREADLFASHLLCPRDWISDVSNAAELMKICYVSRACAERVMAERFSRE